VARPVVSAVIHSGWRAGSLNADVALLRLGPGGPRVPTLTLADAAAVGTLRRGTPVAAFGFPAVSTDPANPRGRLSVDVVGDVRGEFLEVGLGVAPGTSGSPVFDRSGLVVGIVVGGDFIEAPSGGTRPTGSSANWALSADTVRQLLDRQ
jgi:S1-C subfamily serine protease